MKSEILFLLVLMLAAGPAQAQVNALPPTRHILVYGDAQARAVPDRFRIEIVFNVMDEKADTARRKVQAYLEDTIGKLEASSVRQDDIVATSLEIEPRSEYDQMLRKQVYKGIGVTRKVSARFDDHEDLKAFLSLLETSEEVQVSGVTTELSTEPELKRQLRQKAIESTREKASVIADAYGARLSGLYSVSDSAPQFEYGITEGDWPVTYEWHADSTTLDRIEVTGSRIKRSEIETFETGYVTFDDRIYAVFLLAE